jgi:hypothetical protein
MLIMKVNYRKQDGIAPEYCWKEQVVIPLTLKGKNKKF